MRFINSIFASSPPQNPGRRKTTNSARRRFAAGDVIKLNLLTSNVNFFSHHFKDFWHPCFVDPVRKKRSWLLNEFCPFANFTNCSSICYRLKLTRSPPLPTKTRSGGWTTPGPLAAGASWVGGSPSNAPASGPPTRPRLRRVPETRGQ